MSFVFQTPQFGRKASYALSDGRDSEAATPVHVAISNEKSGQKISFETEGNPQQGRAEGYRRQKRRTTILLFVAMIVVIVLLLTAIIWLLTHKSSKPGEPRNDNWEGDVRRSGELPTTTTGTKATTTTTTTSTRPTVKVVDPAKPPRGTTTTTLATTTITVTTTAPATTTTTATTTVPPTTTTTTASTTIEETTVELPTTSDPTTLQQSTPTTTTITTSVSTTTPTTTTTASTTTEEALVHMPVASHTTATTTTIEDTTVELPTTSDPTTLQQSTPTTTTIATSVSTTTPTTTTKEETVQSTTTVPTTVEDELSVERKSSLLPSATANNTTSTTENISTTDTDYADGITESIISTTTEHSFYYTTTLDVKSTTDKAFDEYYEEGSGSIVVTSFSSTTVVGSGDYELLDAIETSSTLEGSALKLQATSSTTSEDVELLDRLTPTQETTFTTVDATPSPDRFSTFYSLGTTIEDTETTSNDRALTDDHVFTISSATATTTTTPAPPVEEICNSDECQTVASHMRAVMDVSVHPCKDFYSYSCGKIGSTSSLFQSVPVDQGYNVNQRIASALKRVGPSSPKSWQLFKGYYDQCLRGSNENLDKRIQLVREAVEDVGYFQTKETFNMASFDLTRLLAELILRHSSPVFGVILDVNRHDPSKFAFKIGHWTQEPILFHKPHEVQNCESFAVPNPANIVESVKDLYENYTNCLNNLKNRLDKLEDTILALDVFKGHNETERGQIVSELRFSADSDILHPVEEQKPTAAEVRHALLIKNYTEYTVAELNGYFRGIDWKRFFEILTKNSVTEDEIVQVYFPDYVKKKLALISRVDEDSYKIQNVLLALYASDLYHDIANYDRMSEYNCLELARNLMQDVSSALYLSTYDTEHLDAAKQQLDGIYQEIKETLIEEIQSSVGFSGSVRDSLLNKARQVKAEFIDGSYVRKQADWVETQWRDFDLADSFIISTLALLKRYSTSLFETKKEDPRDQHMAWWHFSLPTTTTGSSVYALNRILIPLAISDSSQLNDKNFPLYMTMAKIGSLLSHELMHHFDPAGLRFAPGSLEADEVKYQESLSCLISETSEEEFFHVKSHIIVLQVNNQLTLNERFSDSAGLNLAFKTYQRRKVTDGGQGHLLPFLNMTDSQLFFLSAAQVFCTVAGLDESVIELSEREHLHPRIRVRELVRNSAEFRTAFKCADYDDTLSADKVCPVFPSY